MKRILAGVVAASVLLCMLAPAADSVEPANATFNSLRGEAQGYVSQETFYLGTPVLFTNCVLYSGTTTNSAKQGLDGVAVALRVGFAATNQSVAGHVQNTSNGTFWALFTLQTNVANPSVQVQITDANTNSYIYPWKLIKTQSPLR